MSDTTSSKPSAVVPGRLRNFVEMTIQSRQAQRLVSGRQGGDGKAPIIGLYRYGAMTRTVWSAAAHNDPYADWFLLQIEQALTESKEQIAHMKATIDADMARVSAMQIGLAQSMDPVKIELTFSNPYGYMGAWLLADMDELVLATLTARHVGLINRDDAHRMLADAGRTVRRAFAVPQGFRATAVKRDDMRGNTKRAERARQIMGELPQAILDGELRPEHAPAVEGSERPTSAGHSVASDESTDATEAEPDGAGDERPDDQG